MSLVFKKLFFTLIFNITLFLVLMLGIQNSSNKRKINLIINETVNLPISFIVGISFLSGSLTGGIMGAYFDKNNR
tara:strand:+ start:1020 stop:1244 length:225 start_codon:yes stop_codon:yes gene_type:complete